MTGLPAAVDEPSNPTRSPGLVAQFTSLGCECIAIRPDRRRALTGSSGQPSWLADLDLETGELIRSLEAHNSPVLAVATTPDGRHAITSTVEPLMILDERGTYDLFADLGPPRGLGRVVTPERRERCISSGELSSWLRPVDAGQLARIVDCCHAAATVEQPGFKPGPMGSRGRGQLAYDKGMWVLAASAAADVALEALVGGEGHGLLTHALIREGRVGQRAAGAGGALTLGGLLKYAEVRRPALYFEIRKAAEGGKGARAGEARVLVARRRSRAPGCRGRAAGELAAQEAQLPAPVALRLGPRAGGHAGREARRENRPRRASSGITIGSDSVP
ncbi:MAG TPA: hypothetical protein VFF52_14810 [Isosphaeraceae bacterium]|nr:hypothetical protein [Isosphaeraceae bacterium]